MAEDTEWQGTRFQQYQAENSKQLTKCADDCRSQLFANHQQLLESGAYSDLTLQCQGKDKSLSKALLSLSLLLTIEYMR